MQDNLPGSVYIYAAGLEGQAGKQPGPNDLVKVNTKPTLALFV